MIYSPSQVSLSALVLVLLPVEAIQVAGTETNPVLIIGARDFDGIAPSTSGDTCVIFSTVTSGAQAIGVQS